MKTVQRITEPLTRPLDDSEVGQRPSPAVDRKRLEDVSFSVSARVAMQLGRESISSSITAIIELVKNAYDADAGRVRICFAGLKSQAPRLVIEDNGFGMRVEDIRDQWMIIGTSHKSVGRKPTSRGRVLTGEKGLGRLGLDRLCARTRIQTKRKNSKTAAELEIDWTRYEGSSERLESIQHHLYELPHIDFDPITQKHRVVAHGTRLILEGLKDKWDEETLRALRSELALMLSPFAGPRDFKVEIESGMEWASVDGPVRVPKVILEAAGWKVVGILDAAGRASIKMDSNFHDMAFRLKKTAWLEFAKHGDELPACGPVRFEFYFFPRLGVSLAEQTLGKAEVETFLNSNQGVRIYRDGFRVKPYGEPDGQGDWLRLAHRRVQSPSEVTRVGAWRLGNNQVVGAVFIGREKNPSLMDQTNREGLLQGIGYRDLRVFATKVVEYFELQRSKFEASRATPETKAERAQQKADKKAKESLEALNRLSQMVTDGVGVSPAAGGAEAVKEFKKVIEQAKQSLSSGQEAAQESAQATQRELEKTRDEKNTMANLASVEILAAAFGHETLGFAGTAEKNAVWLGDHITQDAILLPEPRKQEAQHALHELLSAASKVHSFAKFSLDTVSPAKRKKTEFSLATVVRDVLDAFKDGLVSKRNISVSLVVPGHEGEIDVQPDSTAWESALDQTATSTPLRIRAYPADWESILVNLITNAVWAMDKKPKGERRIRIRLASEPEHCQLTFEDSGRGLEIGTEERVFQPTFSTKRDAKGDVYGTGMGLAIVKSCVEENSGGAVKAIPTGDLGGAVFVVRVPRAKPSSPHK
jgi:hypothetical protein